MPDGSRQVGKSVSQILHEGRRKYGGEAVAAAEIVDTLARTLERSYAFTLVEYMPRGNLLTGPMIEYRHPHLISVSEEDRLTVALANATRVRDRLIDLAVASSAP